MNGLDVNLLQLADEMSSWRRPSDNGMNRLVKASCLRRVNQPNLQASFQKDPSSALYVIHTCTVGAPQ